MKKLYHFSFYLLFENQRQRRVCVESTHRLPVRIAALVLRVCGYRRTATGGNIDAPIVWTFDKGKIPQE